MCCWWGSAMSQVKGLEDWGSYYKCCLCAGLCPVCTFCAAYKKLSEHYKIDEPMWWGKPCLPIFSYMQIIDTVMVRENLHQEMGKVVPDPQVRRNDRVMCDELQVL